MNQQAMAEGRRVLAALTPGPYRLNDTNPLNRKGYEIDPLPAGHIYGLRRIEDARAVLWLLEHAEALLSLAERVAAVQVQSTAEQREWMKTRVLLTAFETLLAGATTLAALVEAVQ